MFRHLQHRFIWQYDLTTAPLFDYHLPVTRFYYDLSLSRFYYHLPVTRFYYDLSHSSLYTKRIVMIDPYFSICSWKCVLTVHWVPPAILVRSTNRNKLADQ